MILSPFSAHYFVAMANDFYINFILTLAADIPLDRENQDQSFNRLPNYKRNGVGLDLISVGHLKTW